MVTPSEFRIQATFKKSESDKETKEHTFHGSKRIEQQKPELPREKRRSGELKSRLALITNKIYRSLKPDLVKGRAVQKRTQQRALNRVERKAEPST